MKEEDRPIGYQSLVGDCLSKLLPSPKRVCQVMTMLVIGFALASIVGQVYRFWPGHNPFLLGLARKFDLNGEANFPTWYQSSTLLLSSILLALIASVKRIAGARYLWHWRILSVIFLYLSIDEAACIHEQADKLGPALHAAGPFYFVWVIPGIVLVSIFVVSYLKFLAHLPARTRWLFVIAGATYVSGALGVEMIEGAFSSHYGEIMEGARAITYAFIIAAEETLEMAGIVVFVYVLLSYLRTQASEPQLQQASAQTVVPMVKARAASRSFGFARNN